jgi:septal ring factor EnvC (AmiA/AmiB activator)
VLPAAQSDRKRAEADLRALNKQIEQQQRQARQDVVDQERLSRALRDAELSVSRASGDLKALRSQRAERAAARRSLEAERLLREAEREATESDLAGQLRAAYFMGRREPLKLLLNQRSPAEFGRNLTYYGYLGRLRAGQIATIRENILKIEDLKRRIDEEDAELASLELRQKQRVSDLESARKQRGLVLASLQEESRNRAAALDRLLKERAKLEKLVADLSRAAEAAPYDANSPFAKLRGKLSWPVAGRIAVSYGATITGGLRSEGIEINADRGTDVRAVHEGKVVYADYLNGLGLLVIIDHGSGYLSLYSHNEELFKAAGSRVQAGDKIATVGDSGGRKQPGLYFQIRQAGKPVDPRAWFRAAAPPTG